MLEKIVEYDTGLFNYINNHWSNGFLDVFLPFMRDQWCWFPMYALILLYFVIRYRSKGFIWVVWCILTIVVSDFVSSQLIKKSVMRARPCHIPNELTDLILRVDCGSGFSFTSSHATNHMALAVFICFTTLRAFGTWRYIFLPWALIIGYAQVYVGVHYPLDVISGFLLGSILGFLSAWGYNKMRWSIHPVSA